MGCNASSVKVSVPGTCLKSDATTLDTDEEVGMGEGSTALISRRVLAGRMVAIKTFKCSLLKYRQAAWREIAALSMLKHENVIDLLSVDEAHDMPKLVLEFCAGGDLFTLLHAGDRIIPWEHKVKILNDVASGMAYLHGHEPMIIHRDLKSLNLLLLSAYSTKQLPRVKVSDLGSCHVRECRADAASSSLTRSVGTSPWMAPEVLSGIYDHAVDVYSFGMVIFEVLAQELPFEGEDMSAVPQLALQGSRPDLDAIPPEVPTAVLEQMQRSWLKNPGDRPSFATMLSAISSCMKLSACARGPGLEDPSAPCSSEMTVSSRPLSHT